MGQVRSILQSGHLAVNAADENETTAVQVETWHRHKCRPELNGLQLTVVVPYELMMRILRFQIEAVEHETESKRLAVHKPLVVDLDLDTYPYQWQISSPISATDSSFLVHRDSFWIHKSFRALNMQNSPMTPNPPMAPNPPVATNSLKTPNTPFSCPSL